MHRHLILSRLLLLSFLAAPDVFAQESQRKGFEWPGWRGAAYDDAGAAEEGLDGPLELRVAWRRRVGSGYSAVAVADGRVVTLASDEGFDWVVALDAESGDELWRTRIGPTFTGHDGAVDGPVSTPTIAGGRVFALGPFGDLLALDSTTGERLWSVQLAEELGAAPPHWGFTTAPVVVGDRVVLMTGGGADSAFTAFDVATGKVRWRAGEGGVEYQSPILVTLAGRDQIVGATGDYLYGLDPTDGAVLWKHQHNGTRFYVRILNPTYLPGDRLLLKHRDTLSKLVEVQSDDAGDFSVEEVWTSRHLRLNYNMAVHEDGFVYGHGGDYLTCIDAETGDLQWRSREPGNGWIIRVGERLVVLTKAGTLHLAPAAPEGYEEESRLNLFERQTWTPPSFAYGRVYARDSFSDVACVELVPAGALAADDFVGEGPETDDEALVAAVRSGDVSFPRAEGPRHVRFAYMGAAEDVALRCDLIQATNELSLRRIEGTNVFTLKLEAEPDSRFAYQIVEDFDRNIPDPMNPERDFTFFGTEVSRFDMPHSAGPPAPGPLDDDVLLGRLERQGFQAEERDAGGIAWTGSRNVTVYLPPHYELPDERFPVVYFHYGRQMIDVLDAPRRIERWLEDGLPPFIAVFVYSTSAYEYARSHKEAHRQLMVEEIVPWIDGTYRTLANSENRALVGVDEGAYGALWIAGQHPNVFGRVGSQSLWAVCARDAHELADVLGSAPELPERAYLDWGAYDRVGAIVGTSVPAESRRMAELLRRRGVDVTIRATQDGWFASALAERLQGLLEVLLAE